MTENWNNPLHCECRLSMLWKPTVTQLVVSLSSLQCIVVLLQGPVIDRLEVASRVDLLEVGDCQTCSQRVDKWNGGSGPRSIARVV